MGGLLIISDDGAGYLCSGRISPCRMSGWRCSPPGSSGAVGFWDDYLKKSAKVLPGCVPPINCSWRLASPAVAVGLLYMTAEPGSNVTRLNMPFLKQMRPDLGCLVYPLWGRGSSSARSNAVNLTDGLMDCATGPFIIATFVYAGIAYVVGNANFADYLNLMHIRGRVNWRYSVGAARGQPGVPVV